MNWAWQLKMSSCEAVHFLVGPHGKEIDDINLQYHILCGGKIPTFNFHLQ